MNGKERTRAAINHIEPDQPPLYISLTPQVAKKLAESLHLLYEPSEDSLLFTRISHMRMLAHMGVDCIRIAATYPFSSPSVKLPDGKIRNE
ncbi:MAG: hypothetical protein GYA22_02430 [Bacteroidales bacterium]|nr:hypothetical protein [Bacteroidales bacterium]